MTNRGEQRKGCAVHLKTPVRSAETLGLMTAEARIGTNQKQVFIQTCDGMVEPLDSIALLVSLSGCHISWQTSVMSVVELGSSH